MRKIETKLLIVIYLIMVSFSCKISKKNTLETPKGHIVFMSRRDDNFELYRMKADGSEAVNLTNSPKADYWFSSSEVSKKVYFNSKRDGNEQIYKMNLDGSDQENLSKNVFEDRLPVVSPNGKTILFSSNRDSKSGELYTMDLNGENLKQLTKDGLFKDAASWRNDGKKIVFTMDIIPDSDTVSKSNGEIFIINSDGSNPIQLTNRAGFDGGPVFSPNNKKIAFYGRSESGNSDLFLMNTDGSEIENLTNDKAEDYSPSWSPDGGWLAYTSGDKNNYDIWIINLKTKDRKRLTTQPKRDETPFWIK